MNTPCKDCMDRHENCHASCSLYKEWRAQLDENRSVITKARIANAELTRRKNDAIRKMKRKHGTVC